MIPGLLKMCYSTFDYKELEQECHPLQTSQNSFPTLVASTGFQVETLKLVFRVLPIAPARGQKTCRAAITNQTLPPILTI